MKEIQESYDLLVRGGNAAAGCSYMWTGTRGGENYCGNLLWQSGLTLLFSRLLQGGKIEYRYFRRDGRGWNLRSKYLEIVEEINL